jgi:aspartate-semialdehyde dehydrogenase
MVHSFILNYYKNVLLIVDLEEYDIPDEIKSCPSSPMQPIVTYSNVKNPERPQPRLDRFKGNGMSISVGRIRQCPLFDFKFSCIVHNTILGAAGSAVLNAEIAVKRGTID